MAFPAVGVCGPQPGVSLRPVPLTRATFVVGLLNAVPEVRGIVTENTDDLDGDVLLHLLVADLRRLTLAAWVRRDEGLTARCLLFLDDALRDGDDDVQNAVAVSFVEDIGWWDESVQPFLRTWPTTLAAELRHQRGWRG